MENPTVQNWDIPELAAHLRRERLFINSEQAFIQDLNEKVTHSSSRLAQLAWITSHQRLNLNRLVVSRMSPSACCKKAKVLEATKFVDAQSVMGYPKCHSYGELLRALRDSPELVSKCLVEGDVCLPEEVSSFVNSLVAGLYSSCVLPKDRSVVLKILSHLISLQMIKSETPRRLLRPNSCAFSCLYSAFHENLYSAKLFLTSALHEPIKKLLMMDERYLDIDPEKVAIRLEERSRLLGSGDDQGYKVDLETHRASTVQSLVDITQIFIASIRENLHSFPSPVFWLVNQIYMRLLKAKSVTEKEVFAICTDLVFTLFICPAIVKPEPHGITDIPVGSVASFNLIQVAQIIQMLALRKYESIDPKLEDLYAHFDKDCVSSIIEFIVQANLPAEYEAEDSAKVGLLTMSSALFTEYELNSLVNFLRTVSKDLRSGDVELQKELNSLLTEIPLPTANGHGKLSVTSPEAPTKKTNLLSKVGKHRNHSADRGPAQDKGSNDKGDYDPIVLIIPFDMNYEPTVGIDSEQKILGIEKNEIENNMDKLKIENSSKTDGQEKRTRFSLSHDDGSIGNTSDNLEVVSEAPSNPSVASSLELETEDQNDNLSDMVSANVSGRGSPNVSGRDTPSSQIIEEEEIVSPSVPGRQQLYYNPPTPSKRPQSQSRFDIDDKFGKFEIKTLVEGAGADETFSLVSDTWSTDVLASDSELLEQQPSSQQAAATLNLLSSSVLLEPAAGTTQVSTCS
ncbi:GTPase activator activity [Nesidiocoris tenuis]|uniref:GTPase activator activity n=1 Tax=Nesidiocoris tenuis TaxID=355587 RepID=A0ABN7B579_9HEMI|nr:GTPase activator activity [Nesidiocoris tenuis]